MASQYLLQKFAGIHDKSSCENDKQKISGGLARRDFMSAFLRIKKWVGLVACLETEGFKKKFGLASGIPASKWQQPMLSQLGLARQRREGTSRKMDDGVGGEMGQVDAVFEGAGTNYDIISSKIEFDEIAPCLLHMTWTVPFDAAEIEGVFVLVPCNVSNAPGKPYDKMCLSGGWASQFQRDFDLATGTSSDNCGTGTAPPCQHNFTETTNGWGTWFGAITLDSRGLPVLWASYTKVPTAVASGDEFAANFDVLVQGDFSPLDCRCLSGK